MEEENVIKTKTANKGEYREVTAAAIILGIVQGVYNDRGFCLRPV